MLRNQILILILACMMINPVLAPADETPANKLSDASGPVEIFIFSDYFCPPCQSIEPYLEDALTKLYQSGAGITFVDMPFSTMTPVFSKYYLYAINAVDSFTEKLLVRRALFDIARTSGVSSESELIQKLKAKHIKLVLLDVKPLFDQWVALINRFSIKSTPTCVVIRPGQAVVTYTGNREVAEGIDQLLKEMPDNS
jgi:thiol:disulfide interchange protein DsbA